MRCEQHGRQMVSEVGRDLASGYAYLWWRCPWGHVTEPTRLPDSLTAVAGATLPGSDEACSDRPTTPVLGASFRETVTAP